MIGKTAQTTKEGLYKVIKTVASPLRFFAVVVGLMVFLIFGLAWKSTLPADITAKMIFCAFVVLIVLLVIVTILVICFPKKLTFDQEAHLTMLREKLGDSELPSTYFPGALPNVEANAVKVISQGDKK